MKELEEEIERLKEEVKLARVVAKYWQEQYGHANPEHEWEDFPWERHEDKEVINEVEAFVKNHRPARRVDYGDFTEYQVRCLVADYCRDVTTGMVGWGVPFTACVELRGIAKNDKMHRLISLKKKEI